MCFIVYAICIYKFAHCVLIIFICLFMLCVLMPVAFPFLLCLYFIVKGYRISKQTDTKIMLAKQNKQR